MNTPLVSIVVPAYNAGVAHAIGAYIKLLDANDPTMALVREEFTNGSYEDPLEWLEAMGSKSKASKCLNRRKTEN